MNEKKFVSYEEFGAKGDGVANDFEAIMKAHDYANEMGLPVVTDFFKNTELVGVEKISAEEYLCKTETL